MLGLLMMIILVSPNEEILYFWFDHPSKSLGVNCALILYLIESLVVSD